MAGRHPHRPTTPPTLTPRAARRSHPCAGAGVAHGPAPEASAATSARSAHPYGCRGLPRLGQAERHRRRHLGRPRSASRADRKRHRAGLLVTVKRRRRHRPAVLTAASRAQGHCPRTCRCTSASREPSCYSRFHSPKSHRPAPTPLPFMPSGQGTHSAPTTPLRPRSPCPGQALAHRPAAARLGAATARRRDRARPEATRSPMDGSVSTYDTGGDGRLCWPGRPGWVGRFGARQMPSAPVVIRPSGAGSASTQR